MRFTKEQLAYHDAWRKALREGQCEFTLNSIADARRIRFGLYNAARPFREGKLHDEEVRQAAEECSIRLTPVPGTSKITLSIVSKITTDSMQALLGAIGKTAEELGQGALPRTQEELDIEASQTRLQALLNLHGDAPAGDTNTANVPVGARVTPYYTR